MKLSDLRQRIADAIAPETVKRTSNDAPTAELEPLDAQPITPLPGEAQPLTEAQRANLERLRDRLAPDRQAARRATEIPMLNRSPQSLAEAEGHAHWPIPATSVPEVCIAHRDANCKLCDEHNDDLWVHPRDLAPLCPHCGTQLDNGDCPDCGYCDG